MKSRTLAFGSYVLDIDAGELRRGGRVVPLRPKTWQVLRYLADRPGALVSKEELLRRIWAETTVVPKVLTNVIRELRSALEDPADAPRIIENVHGRGYRFIAPIRARQSSIVTVPDDPAAAVETADPFVGRDDELAQLHSFWRKALGGERQIVFVAGESGIGKTVLVDHFVREMLMPSAPALLLGSGRCIDQQGATEPYGPILQAIEQIAASADGEAWIAHILRRCAPTWLAQIPRLTEPAEMSALQMEAFGAAPLRMMREGVSAIEAIAKRVPLVFVLEDLHWADSASIDFLTFLAQRREPARLMVLCTYRPIEARVRDNPVAAAARTLRQRRQAAEIVIPPFGPASLRSYLKARWGEVGFAEQLIPVLEQHTGGNPLLLRMTIDHFVARGHLKREPQGWELTVSPENLAMELPADVRKLVRSQVEALAPAAMAALEAASVQGEIVSTRVLSAMLDQPQETTDRICADLAEQGLFLRPITERAGKRFENYAFTHALYRRVLYDGMPPAVCRTLHRKAAGVFEQMHNSSTFDVSHRIAFHFESSGDPLRAVVYFEEAAATAARRLAYAEAVQHLRRALAILQRAIEPPDRYKHEGRIQIALANYLGANVGFAHPEVFDAFSQARRSYRKEENARETFRATMGLAVSSIAASRLEQAREFTGELLEIAASHPTLAAAAHTYHAMALIPAGDFLAARDHLLRAAPLEPEPGIPTLVDLRQIISSCLALVLVPIGSVEQSDLWISRSLAHRSTSAIARVITLNILLYATACCGNRALAKQLASESLALCAKYEFSSYTTLARAVHAWANEPHSRQAVAEIRTALAERHVMGERFYDSVLYGLLAEVHLERNEPQEAIACVTEGLAHGRSCGEQIYESELNRLKGEILLSQFRAREKKSARRGRRKKFSSAEPSLGDVEICFRQALATAVHQEAALWQLRAATSLARLLADDGRTEEARAVIEPALDALPPPASCPEAQAARRLITEISSA